MIMRMFCVQLRGLLLFLMLQAELFMQVVQPIDQIFKLFVYDSPIGPAWDHIRNTSSMSWRNKLDCYFTLFWRGL
jgi:hypothetical protein